jgi:predicted HAD superfamily hydrolase
MNLLLKWMYWKYPNKDAINSDKNRSGARIRLKTSMINGTYFILIRHGIQQKVVKSSGFWLALWNKKIITKGNHPNE